MKARHKHGDADRCRGDQRHQRRSGSRSRSAYAYGGSGVRGWKSRQQGCRLRRIRVTGAQDVEEVVDVMRTDAIRVDGAEHYHADVAHRQRVARARCDQVNDVALPEAVLAGPI